MVKQIDSNLQALKERNSSKKKNSFSEFFQKIQLRISPCYRQSSSEFEYFTKKLTYDLLPIGRHGLTAGWLLNSLDGNIEKDVVSVHCEQPSSDGFVSQIIRVTLSIKGGQERRFIVKMPETNNIRVALERTTKQKLPEGADDQFISGLSMFYNREVQFYSMERIPGIRLPHIYHLQPWIHGKSMGAIVMQDLKGMISVPYYQNLNLHQISSIGSQLQSLHLFSIDMSAEWKSKFPFPMELISTLSAMHELVELFVTRHPVLRERFKTLEKLYNDPDLFTMLLRDSHKSLGIDDFLCHGDLWFYNLMWLPVSSNSSCASNHLGAIIDWQNVHTGNIAEDFGHLLTFCCDTDTRRQAENVYLPFYYNELCSKARLIGKTLRLTLNQFLRAYRRNFIAHALHFPFIASVLLCVKPANDENEQKRRTKMLVDKVIGAWDDALQAMREEYPDYQY